MIDDYSFGHISIDGTEYTSDIIIFPDGRIKDSWWRKSGHRLCIEDIGELINIKPQIIIAGTGSPGLMKPDQELKKELAYRGIEFEALSSKEAVALYNKLSNRMMVGACFHLTC